MCLIKKKQELNSLVLIVPKTAPQNKSPQINLIWGLCPLLGYGLMWISLGTWGSPKTLRNQGFI
jgi:hypothetical protein